MENICDWKNCKQVGNYKAPVEKDNSRKFRWLCLVHIKEFNKSWDYFNGMSEDQIFNFIKSDMTWHKPTQSFGSSDNFFNILWNNTLNNENIFSINHSTKKNFNEKDVQAFKIMDLEIGITWDKIQSKFKSQHKHYFR